MRSKMPSVLTQVNVAKVNPDYISILTTDQLWNISENEIENSLNKSRGDETKKVDVRVLDVPYIHLGKNISKGRYNINLIFEKLADIDNADIFSLPSIKALIELKWFYIKSRIIVFLMLPYVMFLTFFSFYTIYDLMIYETYIAQDRE